MVSCCKEQVCCCDERPAVTTAGRSRSMAHPKLWLRGSFPNRYIVPRLADTCAAVAWLLTSNLGLCLSLLPLGIIMFATVKSVQPITCGHGFWHHRPCIQLLQQRQAVHVHSTTVQRCWCGVATVRRVSLASATCWKHQTGSNRSTIHQEQLQGAGAAVTYYKVVVTFGNDQKLDRHCLPVTVSYVTAARAWQTPWQSQAAA